MARILVQPTGEIDLADKFVEALSLLKQQGFKPRAGTKLVSKYGVIVVEDEVSAPAVEHLRAGNVDAAVEQ
jgi:hypothetical protein